MRLGLIICLACLARERAARQMQEVVDHGEDLVGASSSSYSAHSRVEASSPKALTQFLVARWPHGNVNLARLRSQIRDVDLDRVRVGVDRSVEEVKRRPATAISIVALARAILSHARLKLQKRKELQSFHNTIVTTKPYHITIVTTAALPWMTGTAVNAMLRAAYCADVGHQVTLCVPWIHPEEQAQIFPGGKTFATPDEQEKHIREWLLSRDGEHHDFEIRFYPARYDIVRGSILPLGDTTRWLGNGTRDLCVLEEPEHLNWYHGGENWRKHFKLVVGVVHTNYLMYAQMYQPENAFPCKLVNNLVCRSYCDRVIKLSDCLQNFPRSTVCNVHGVRSEFIDEGRRVAARGPDKCFKKGAYFIGKTLYAKGLGLLIDYLSEDASLRHKSIDVYGEGEDRVELDAAAKAMGVKMKFAGRRDHSDASLRAYKVFVNPSRTEVLSTTTAEALAMGKFVVIEKHPSNEFFYQFSNTLTYESPEEFRVVLEKALSSTPAPMTAAESRALSWPGATERFLDLIKEGSELATSPCARDSYAHFSHRWLVSGWKGLFGDLLRKYVYQSGPISRQRWLNNRQYRKSTSVVEIVDKSVVVSPPQTKDDWKLRYNANA